MRGRSPWLAGLALVVALPALACGGDDDGGSGGGGAFGLDGGGLATLSGALAVMPDSGENQAVVWGDLARAAEIAGLDRPTDPADTDAVVDYVMAVSGTSRDEGDTAPPVAVVPPKAAGIERLVELPGFVDDVGWSILQVDRFVERQTPPDSITVLEGDFDDGALTDAMGEPTDDVWVAGSGEPGEVSIEDRTPARPIGETLWLSRQAGDGLVSVTASPESQESTDAALGGDPGGAVLGDDPALAALAAALDEQSPYAAMVGRPGINGIGASGAVVTATPEQAAQLCEEELLTAPTAAVGTGVTSDDEGPVVLIALAHASADAAGANADALERIVTEGASLVSREPWSERFELDSVETSGEGDRVVIARLRPIEPIGTRLWYDLIAARENLITSC